MTKPDTLIRGNKVLLFSHDPGGTNTLIPLIAPLREKGYNVRLYGKAISLERYKQAGVEGIDIMTQMSDVTSENAERFLLRERPDFLISGTSAEDFTERYLWGAAEHVGIPSFAILDQWVNYGIRFSPYGLSDSAKYPANPTHPFLPSRIIVMDEFAKQEMINMGVTEADRILPLGQPYFETLKCQMESMPSSGELREKLGIGEGVFLMTFVSEPVTSDYGDDGEFWGFTEKTIFSKFLAVLERCVEQHSKRVHLVVKQHPREAPGNLVSITERALNSINVTIDRSGDPMELIHVSDLVCGMSSMMLIESAIVGKPVLSMMMGLRRENPFVLDRRGIIRSARSDEEVEMLLLQALSGIPGELGRFEVPRNPVRAIIGEMEKMLS